MKKTLIASVFFALMVLTGCEKEQSIEPDLSSPTILQNEDSTFTAKGKKPADSSEGWINYQIPEGVHQSSNTALTLFSGDSMAFYFSFDSTALYQTRDPANQEDWNKLMGFSDCQSHHHQNSVRLVWRWNEGAGIEIGEYFYRNGQRSFAKLTTVQVGDTNFAMIAAQKGFYHLQVNDVSSEQVRRCANRNASYWLYPYFGGDEVAPHSFNIFIKQLWPIVKS